MAMGSMMPLRGLFRQIPFPVTLSYWEDGPEVMIQTLGQGA